MKLTFVESKGREHPVEVEPGISVMQAALDHLVPGILGDCGGACSCATCHVYVDPPWVGALPPLSEEENQLLEGVLDRRPGSRLGCQVRCEAALDGIVVRLPSAQF